MFDAEHDNIKMAFNIYQTALEEGVRRVVVASSNHAADFYEPHILNGTFDTVDPMATTPRADNFYGWAKIAYENLGFVYAARVVNGKGDTALENVQIRIGGPRETDVAASVDGGFEKLRRALGAYMSERDMQQLFIKSIEVRPLASTLLLLLLLPPPPPPPPRGGSSSRLFSYHC